MSKTRNVLRRSWEAIGYALTLLGIFWLPKDMSEWSDAAAPWKRWLSMIDQNTALWIFAIAALAYIGWMDIRPMYRDWRGGSKSKPVAPQSASHNALHDRESLEVSALKASGELGAVSFPDDSNGGDLSIEADGEVYQVFVTLDAPFVGRAVRVWDHDESIHSVWDVYTWQSRFRQALWGRVTGRTQRLRSPQL